MKIVTTLKKKNDAVTKVTNSMRLPLTALYQDKRTMEIVDGLRDAVEALAGPVMQ